jgi:sarcosine oxidase subunit beta
MNRRYRVVIIGAGIMGLATAYHLAEHGINDVLVVDRGYVCGGASGRNGGGVRAQFSSETNIRLMQDSIRICRDFAARMKINVWFRQGGYLFLTRTAERARMLEASVELQNRCGLPTRLLEPAQTRDIVPELDPTGIVRASFNPDDGVLFPWPFLWGYAKAAKDRGCDLATFMDVVGLEVRGDRIARVVMRPTRHEEIAGWDRHGPTSARGSQPMPSFADVSRRVAGERIEVECDDVVCCAGAWSPELARMVGIELPNRPHRHEICSTEPLKPWLGPLVADLTDGLYFSQSARGELVGGIGVDPVPPGINQRSSVEFLATYARSLVRTIPRLAGIKVLRQWAGCYDLTPDGSPIVGRVGTPSNLVLACGFTGHGFMMAPVMGRLLAEHVATGTTSDLFARWSLKRFAEGRLARETMIIG